MCDGIVIKGNEEYHPMNEGVVFMHRCTIVNVLKCGIFGTNYQCSIDDKSY